MRPGSRVEVSATAWSSRRLTTAGVAPMSLIETRTPASGWRAWKSSQHRLPDRAEAARRRSRRRRGSAVPAARLEQHLEVARADDADQHRRDARPAGWPPVKRKSRVSMPPSLDRRPHQLRKRLRRLVQAARGAHQVACIERAASRLRVAIALVDAEVLGAADHAAVAQVLDRAPVARQAHRRCSRPRRGSPARAPRRCGTAAGWRCLPR